MLSISVAATDPLPRMLTEARVPVVLFGRPAETLAISYVDVAQDTGAAMAADHLVARGCQRVATICGPADTPAGADRLSGFREAMARHGRAYVPAVEGNFTHDGGESAMLALAPTTIRISTASSSRTTSWRRERCSSCATPAGECPRTSPSSASTTACVALSTRPKLTTVRQPVEEMAAAMVRLLLTHIEDRARPVASVIFDPTLVIRDSA